MGDSVALTVADQKAEARRQQAVLKAVSDCRATIAKAAEQLARLEELVAEGQSSAKALYVEFRGAWEHKTGDTYIGSAARDIGQLRRLRSQLSDQEIRHRMARFFQGNDEFARKTAWSLGCFCAMINQLGRAHGRSSTQSSSDDLLREMGVAE